MGQAVVRILGLDPGLLFTGWGVIDVLGSSLRHVAHGVLKVPASDNLAERLAILYGFLEEMLVQYAPLEAAVEETFVNVNATSTLKLGAARGVVLLAPALRGIPVAEYSANKVKKSVVGAGHAQKDQVSMMVQTLLPQAGPVTKDAADALAVAICHAHYRNLNQHLSQRWEKAR